MATENIIFTVGNTTLELYPKDLDNKLTFYQASDMVLALGDGWRLPTREEFAHIYTDLFTPGKLAFTKESSYWTSDEVDGKPGMAYTFYFDTGKPFDDIKDYATYVRLVRVK